jgi:signal transduction histidine kinase
VKESTRKRESSRRSGSAGSEAQAGVARADGPKPRGKPNALPRLADFIRDNTEQILSEWESFARGMPIAASMDIAALRDHAKDILAVIATDLETPQTVREETAKAKGHADAPTTGRGTAAQAHGAGRAGSGFSVEQMVAEFRALRASVIRLWMKGGDQVRAVDLDDMTRFNEAIDQSIAESIVRYNTNITHSKERFLAILGHDLKNPIGSIMNAAQFMLDVSQQKGDLAEPYRGLVTRVGTTSRRMNKMVHDLLDFARTSFGDSIPITRADMDAGVTIRGVQAEVSAMYPTSSIAIDLEGDLRGNWDSERLAQALTNLVGNAVQHGAGESTICVAARGLPTEVTISVSNRGPLIPRDEISQLFSAIQKSGNVRRIDDQHLGLGLYIVDKIISAHGGSIDVESTDANGTVFTIRLPRE